MNSLHPALLFYSAALVLAMGLCITIAFFAFRRVRVPGAQAFLFGNLAAFFYALGSLLEITATTANQVLAALAVEYMGIATVGPLLFLTTISATQGARVVSARNSILLFLVPAVALAAVVTNDFHHLFYTSIEVTKRGPFTIPILGRGPLFMLNLVYMNLTILWGVLVPLGAALKAPRVQRDPLLLLVAGSLFPWMGMALYLSGLSPWGLDVAPFGLAISELLFAVAMFRFRLFDLAPLFTDQVFANMREGVLVVDAKQRIIGINPAMASMFPGLSRADIGRPVGAVGLPDLAAGEVTLNNNGRQVYQVDRSPLRDDKGSKQGEIFMLTDISQRVELAERLAVKATIDDLTGLPNRREVLERLAAEGQRLTRYGGSSVVAIADVDHFKLVNDTYGHEAGDAALKHVAQLWSAALRTSDVVARYGGEEFLFLLPQTTADEGRVLLERLRSTLEHRPLEWKGQTLSLTASFGLSAWEPAHETAETAIRRADEALYRAKDGGRNRVC